MDFNDFAASLQQAFAPQLLNVIGAIGILVIGWLIAVIVRAGVRRGLAALQVDARVTKAVGDPLPIERPVSLAFFWLIILMTIVGVFSALNLTDVAAPIQALVTQVIAYLPRIFAAAVLFAVAWLVATVCKAVVARLLRATSLDDRLSASAGMAPMSGHASNALFWLIMLMFLPAIVGTLGIAGLVGPLEGLTNQLVGMLPNIFAALVIVGVGWLVARILRALVTSAVSALGIDRHAPLLGTGATAGDGEGNAVSRAAGTVVFVLVLVPAIVAALDALQIEAISQPAGAMLGQFLAAIPNIVAAAVILGVAWVIARLVANLATRVAATAGVDAWPTKLGITAASTESVRPSKLLGSLTLFFIMLFAATEAANQLALTRLADMLASFI